MAKASIGHLVYCIDMQNAGFYRDLLTRLGWSVWHDAPEILGMGDDKGVSIWFNPFTKAAQNDYDGAGLNHTGLHVESQSDVDEMTAYLASVGVKALFETPRHRPEFAGSPENTYYQVMFESPDRILWEIVYIGKREI